jgi:hypothetical protein
MRLISFKIVLLLLCTNLFGQDIILPDILLPVSSQQINAFNFIVAYQMGVAANGLSSDATYTDDEFIGNCNVTGEEDHLGGAWHPINGFKKTLCGNLMHKSKLEDIDYSDDEDYGGHITPDAEFNYLITQSVNPYNFDHSDKYDVDYTGTIHFEIDFEDKVAEKFIADDPEHFAVNKETCIYGSWVADKAHDNLTEIHPMQQYWQLKGLLDNIDSYSLSFLLDKSGRYESVSDYHCLGALPSNLWLTDPNVNSFYIAFQTPLNAKESYNYFLSEALTKSLINISEVHSNFHQLVYLNQVLLTVTIPVPEKYRLEFTNVRLMYDNLITGYLKITISIEGEKNLKTGGYTFLNLVRQKNKYRKLYSQQYAMNIKSIKRLDQEGSYTDQKFKGVFILSDGEESLQLAISLREGESKVFNSVSPMTQKKLIIEKINETGKIVKATIYNPALGFKAGEINLIDEPNGIGFSHTDFNGTPITKQIIFSTYRNALYKFELAFTLTEFTAITMTR